MYKNNQSNFYHFAFFKKRNIFLLFPKFITQILLNQEAKSKLHSDLWYAGSIFLAMFHQIYRLNIFYTSNNKYFIGKTTFFPFCHAKKNKRQEYIVLPYIIKKYPTNQILKPVFLYVNSFLYYNSFEYISNNTLLGVVWGMASSFKGVNKCSCIRHDINTRKKCYAI